MEIPPEIVEYYSALWDEDVRLRSGLNQLELVRTQELVRRHLPDGPQRIIDIGGASGVHAAWLLDDGHTVHLIDPIDLHVEQAREALGGRDGFTAACRDGRDTGVTTGSFDVALLLGPLYHLTDRRERMAAWREAIRVVTSGGLVFAAAISRFASLFSGLSEGVIFEEDFRSMVSADLVDGQHRNPKGKDYFTTAFFHHPDEFAAEANAAGLVDVRLVSVEGPAGAMPHLEEDWNDPVRRGVILDFVRRVEQERSLAGIGPHLMIIGRVP